MCNEYYYSLMTERGELGTYIARGVRARRVWLGLGQVEVARRLGCSGQTVSAIERGLRKVTVDDLPALCRALDTTFAALLHGADPNDLRAVGLDEPT
jgi:transcriptional regulator with XRE-family HTH domain